MKQLHYLLPFCFLLFIQMASIKAAHIVGGYMSYECLGGNDYRFKMVLFRDCFGGGAPFDSALGSPFPGTVSLYVGDSQSPLQVNGQNHIELAPPVITAIVIDGTTGNCTFPPSTLCLEEGVYTFDLTLPATNEPIHVVYQRCCRTATTTNIINPGSSGMTFVQTITPEARAVCNNSPVFNKHPMACAEIDLGLFFHDHSAVDVDGDSLVYSFCAPYAGGGNDTNNATSFSGVAPDPDAPPPYLPVEFINSLYSAEQPIPGSPQYLINAESGVVIGQGSITGAFVYGICVEEYRNGVLLGTSHFEFIHRIVGTPLATDERQDADMVLRAFPNPTSGDVVLELLFSNEYYTIELLDINGKKCRTANDVQSGQYQLDIADLPKGVYNVTAFNGGMRLYTRILRL